MSFQAKMVTDSAVTVIVKNQSYQVGSTHVNFKEIMEALRNDDSDTFVSLINQDKGTETYVTKDSLGNDTGIVVTEDGVTYKGRVLHNVIVDRILAYRQKGFPIDDMVKFLENLMQNPSSSSVNELFDFMQNRSLPITENGNFIGYKAVKNDYYSKTSGKTVLIKGQVRDDGRIFNGIGEEIECERNQVDDNRENNCSNGLHIGGLDYATVTFRNGDDKVVLVEVNPKDVVSVPRDCNAQKLRTCAYKVIGEYSGPLDDLSTREYYEEDLQDYDYYQFEDVLTVEDLEEGDDIFFTYDGKVRSVKVVALYVNYFTGVLSDTDINYCEDTDIPSNYRNFVYSKITELEYA